ncbi:hypothetical protein G6O67_003666 [Ophiocordyceps sinensis]|uniref:DUF92 domain protein n=1 Tax=Ophiocordyceps sinensis TaxID=72228 RepID=A0A8H4V6H6_9HYPO|nr:hypothetical protein G6O67_003666 [Ophiocordyceps sinensis]
MKPIFAVPLIALLVGHAWHKKSLTPAGLVAGALSAIAHTYHPWNLPAVLLIVFFLAGTRVTRVKENVKATLTVHSRGTSGGEGPRTHVQVLANSLMGSIISLLHAYQLRSRAAAYASPDAPNPEGTMCFSWGGDLLMVGLIANYAAVAADTFSSELGILSNRLFGSMVIVTTAMLFLPACSLETASTLGGGMPWTTPQRRVFMGFMVVWGALGSVLDSLLGATLQRSVRDARSGKIVEGEGGNRVLVSSGAERAVGGSTKRAEAKAAALSGQGNGAKEQLNTSAVDDEHETAAKPGSGSKHGKSSFSDERPSRVIESGWDLLDNNDVNFLMASIMSVGGMAVASWYWGVPLENVIKP